MYKLKEGKISSHGLFNIVVILLLTKLFLGIPRALVIEAGSAGWLLILMSAIVAGVGIFVLTKLLKRFPGKNIVEISELVWGVPGRVFTSLIIFLLFLYISTVVVREFAETMLTTVLPGTPISIIILTFVVTMIFGAYKGIEVITRSAVLLFPFIAVGILSILFLTANFINLNNLFPIFGEGLTKIAYHAPGKSSIFIDIIFIGLIASSVSDFENIPRQLWKGFFISVVMFVLVQVVYISVMNVSAGEKLYIPLYHLAKIIYMGRFVQRIEALYIFVWFFSGALQLTISLYGAAVSLSTGFKIPIFQPLLFPLGLLVFSLSFIPSGILAAVYLDINALREYGAIPGWGIPLALLLTSFIRKKGGACPEK